MPVNQILLGSTAKPPISEFEVQMWGGGGGSGSQNLSSGSYHTSTYSKIKSGGAGGYVYAKFEIEEGTQLILTVGQGGNGANVQGQNQATACFNGGGAGGKSANDESGGGGGYTGVFKVQNQAGALCIAPGGGGGAGGPGYPVGNNDQANGGGGIVSSNGTGNAGTRGNQYSTVGGGGGTPTAGGAKGTQTYDSTNGNDGSALAGGNGIWHTNGWGSGGGGGGGWFGGGSGPHDGNSWSGGGGGAGSAFVRGSGITYNSDGNAALDGVTYVAHDFTRDGSNYHAFGHDGDGTNNTGGGNYNQMRGPVRRGESNYGNSAGWGGDFPTSNVTLGNNGNGGRLVWRKKPQGGSWTGWTVLNYTGSNVNITI